MLTTDHEAPRPYPRLSEVQKARVLDELIQEYALDNLRPVQHNTVVTTGAQLELFEHGKGKR
jgi:hypothetical protein